jgi:hypothetical protein
MSSTPKTDNYKQQGREWLPLGLYEDMESLYTSEVERSKRKDVLLRAAYDLLMRSDQTGFVQEAKSILVRYDDADCDGNCLMDDIATELDLEEGTKPLKLFGT